jgi:steroid delta-isomerase-like uncharacterized protein
MTQLADQVREYFRALDARELDRAADMLAADCDFIAPGFSTRSPEQAMMWMRTFFDACPDIRHEVTAVVADGDRAMTELRVRGTHTGPLQSPAGEVPATGRTIDLPVANAWRMRDGRVAVYHIYFDRMEFLGQLGLLPEPATAA